MSKKDYRDLDRPIKSTQISSPKKTAYEELKAWCEKYLDESQWRATDVDEWGNPTIDIGEATHIFSQDTGRYLHTVFYN